MIPQCRIGGECDLVSRDEMLVPERPGLPRSIGIAQCVKCSEVYQAQDWQPRTCASCHEPYGEMLADPCLRLLAGTGVVRACCGHGDVAHAYAAYHDGTLVEGAAVLGLGR